MRPKHYLKNILIFIPLVFSKSLLDTEIFIHTLLVFISFSLVASVIYILNDLFDVEKDKLHPIKKNRPIASGRVTKRQAIVFAALLALSSATTLYISGLSAWGILMIAIYLSVNVAYSAGLKNIPIVDVGIIALGFILRVMIGAEAAETEMSRWLYLTILTGAFYLGLGKRRSEIHANGAKSRTVNQYYTVGFLDRIMYVCMSVCLVFYSLWATDSSASASFYLTIPVVMLIFMAYSYSIESLKDGAMGDPVEVVSGNRVLLVLSLILALLSISFLYL